MSGSQWSVVSESPTPPTQGAWKVVAEAPAPGPVSSIVGGLNRDLGMAEGALYGVNAAPLGLAQLAGRGVQALTGYGGLANWATQAAAKQRAAASATPGGNLGYFAGDTFNPLYFIAPETKLGAVPDAVIAGLGGAAAQPVTSGPYWQTKGLQGALGALTGAGLGSLAGKFASTAASPSAAYARRGVPLTPGQALGGFTREAEGVLASTPAGALISPALDAATAGWNRTIYDDIARHFGTTYSGPVGHPAIESLQKTAKQAYAQALDNWKIHLPGLRAPYAAQQPEIATIDGLGLRAEYDDLAPQSQADVRREVSRLVTRPWGVGARPATITGQAFKRADSALGDAVLQYRSPSNNAYGQQAGYFLSLYRRRLRAFVGQLDPQRAAQLANVDRGYAMLQVTEQAAADASKTNGVFSYDQLISAAKKAAGASRRNEVARGSALLQREARQGREALAPVVRELPWLRTESFVALPFLAAAHPLEAAKAATAMIPWLPGVRQGLVKAAVSPGTAPALRALAVPAGAAAGQAAAP